MSPLTQRPWRSLEEHRRGGAAEPEFPPGADLAPDGLSRRQALELGALAAAAGGLLSGCFRPAPEELVPYVAATPGVPGVPQHYATLLEYDGYARGVIVTCHEHRPTKVEGNPGHPGSLGAAGAQEQASLLDLFDSTRARTVRVGRRTGTKAQLVGLLRTLAAREDHGEGLRVLAEPSASPLRAQLYAQLLERYPRARIVPASATLTGNAQAGAQLAFGRALAPVPDFLAAHSVMSLDAELLATLSGDLGWARGIVETRAKHADARLWSLESHLSVTGMFADGRLRAKPSRVPHLARALAARVGELLKHGALAALKSGLTLSPQEARWTDAAARHLVAHRNAALVAVGERQPPEVHALGHLLNEALGAAVRWIADPLSPLPNAAGRDALVRELRAGAVDTLLITAWNPAFTEPLDCGLADALPLAANAVYCGLHEDETAARCAHFAPSCHAFESWSDGRSRDGTAAIQQPLIAPLFGDLFDPLELFGPFVGEAAPISRLKDSWYARLGRPLDFEDRWRGFLSDGFVPDSALPTVTAAVDAGAVSAALRTLPPPGAGLELAFVPSLTIGDGRFAGNAWLQELPDPVTKLTWDTCALLSPATAARLDVERGRRVHLTVGGATIEAAALPVPGHADDTITLGLGYGRTLGPPLALGVGPPTALLRSAGAPWSRPGLAVQRLEATETLPLTQDHWTMHGRALALRLTRDELDAHQDELEELRADKPHMYPLPVYAYPPSREAKPPPHRWGMAIDLDRCTGCSACVVACQAENNIPTVGREQVVRGREMQWLRIDRYFLGDDEGDPGVVTQPLMCVHCEYAPCEYVCPVFATLHSDEGLNQMVYNRCIGTRYCSNNCPYKVRRFNYLDYVPKEPLARAHQNPQVTVRSRGVMEKCTYCVQRIEAARIDERAFSRKLSDGAVVTACQQACPTSAIVFGDLSDPASRVAALHEDDRHYRLLNELGTAPRTVHLVRIARPTTEGA
jgi:molybdopterin-containing oxidoreductase family iron-sulfur binding subunit